METTDVRSLFDDTFRDIALVLGGIFAVHEVQDEAVWQVMKHLDLAHETALSKLAGPEAGQQRPGQQRQAYAPHPAVEALLMKLKRHPHGGGAI